MAGEIAEGFVEVSGSRVFHRYSIMKGNTRNIVLLHGWSFTSKDWQNVGAFSRLSRLGYNVYSPDYPGFGMSPISERYAIQRGIIGNGALFIHDYAEAVGLGRLSVLGASMGGGMAISFAIETPEMVDKVIAVAPAWIEGRKDDLRKILRPVLFVWGSQDSVVPVSLGPEYSALVKGSRLRIIEGARHPAYIDRPDEFFDAVEDFLESSA